MSTAVSDQTNASTTSPATEGAPDNTNDQATDALVSASLVRSIAINGTTYPLGRFKLREMGAFTDWANKALPNPYEAIRPMLDGAAPEDAKAFRALAFEEMRLGPRPFGDSSVLALAQTTDGVKEVLYLSLRRADPTMTRERSDALAEELAVDQIPIVIAAAFRTED